MPVVIILLLACLFSNKIFYSEKVYSDKVIIEYIDKVHNLFKSTRESSSKNLDFLELSENRTYSLSLSVDKKYAFENNFPYFESLLMNIKTFSKDSKLYSSMELTEKENQLLKMCSYIDDSKEIISFPSLSDDYFEPLNGYIEYENDESVSIPSLFAAITSYSGLNADETTELFSQILKDIIYNLPSECYNTQIGICSKSNIVVSVSESELSVALSKAVSKNKNNPNLKLLIKNVFNVSNYDEYMEKVITDLGELGTSKENFYTISLSFNMFGKLKNLILSSMIDGNYNSCSLKITKGKIIGVITDNSKFSNEIKEFTSTSFDLVYGVNNNHTLKGYFSASVDGGSFLMHFDNVAFDSNFISGEFSADMKNGNKFEVSLDSKENQLKASYLDGVSGTPLLALTYCSEENTEIPFDKNSLTSGQRYTDYATFSSNIKSSSAYSEFLENIQYEQFSYWIQSLIDLYSDDLDQ